MTTPETLLMIDLYEALDLLLERAEVLQEATPELDETPFPPALLERARSVLSRAVDRLTDRKA